MQRTGVTRGLNAYGRIVLAWAVRAAFSGHADRPKPASRVDARLPSSNVDEGVPARRRAELTSPTCRGRLDGQRDQGQADPEAHGIREVRERLLREGGQHPPRLAVAHTVARRRSEMLCGTHLHRGAIKRTVQADSSGRTSPPRPQFRPSDAPVTVLDGLASRPARRRPSPSAVLDAPGRCRARDPRAATRSCSRPIR